MNNLSAPQPIKTAQAPWTALLRFCAAFVGALLVTILLVTLMVLMIMRSDQVPTREKPHKIADIWQAGQTPTELIKSPKPKKLPEPMLVPPVLPNDTPSSETFSAKIPNTLLPTAPNLKGINISGPLNIGLGDGGFSRDTDYIPIYVPQAFYPRRALARNKEGYAVVEVTITTTGGVRSITLLEEFPPRYGFGNAALKAAIKLRYNPRVIGGQATEVPGVKYKFSFRME